MRSLLSQVVREHLRDLGAGGLSSRVKNATALAVDDTVLDSPKYKAQAKLDTAKVVGMYYEYHTTEEIAKVFGVSSYTINRCLRENGVKIRSRWDYTQK